jgi:hypothetical protein
MIETPDIHVTYHAAKRWATRGPTGAKADAEEVRQAILVARWVAPEEPLPFKKKEGDVYFLYGDVLFVTVPRQHVFTVTTVIWLGRYLRRMGPIEGAWPAFSGKEAERLWLKKYVRRLDAALKETPKSREAKRRGLRGEKMRVQRRLEQLGSKAARKQGKL